MTSQGRRSRSKGKRGELEVVHLLEEYGFTAKRSSQSWGGQGVPDVRSNIPGVHLEVKRYKRNVPIRSAMAQAVADGQGGEPWVAHRVDGEDWLVTLPLRSLLGWVRQAMKGES